MRGPPPPWSPNQPPPPASRTAPRRRSLDPLMLGAVAGIATVLALGFGTLLGLMVLLVLNDPTQPPATTVEETPVAPSSGAAVITTQTVPAPDLPGRPTQASDPVTLMLEDLHYERQLVHAEPPVAEPAPPPPPSVVSGLWSMLLRLVGLGPPEPPPEVPNEPLIVPIDPRPLRAPTAPQPTPPPSSVVARIEPRPPAPAPRPAPSPAPLPNPSPAPTARPAPAPAPIKAGPIELTDDDFNDDFLKEEFNEAELFIAPGADEEPGPSTEALDNLDALDVVLVQVSVDAEDVPIRIDGREVGTAPGAFQLPAGPHKVELYHRGQFTVFNLQAVSDPESWCFQRRGRAFRQIRCR